jgi:D-serine deaminase-like pyridoxal phosphate-dependent protein
VSAPPTPERVGARGRTPRLPGDGVPPGQGAPPGRADATQRPQPATLARLEQATAELDPPFALLDLDALWANAAELQRRAAPKPIRLASKSLRCRELQRRVLEREGFRGTLAYTLPEALWLAQEGFEDILVAYPTVDRGALRALAELSVERPDAGVAVMVDGFPQLELIRAARAHLPASAPPVSVCIELDAGYRALGGRIRVGARRSPIHTPGQALELARVILADDGLRLTGLMAYEAQIAGLGDSPPGHPLRALAIRAIQARSARELAARRAATVAALRELTPLELVNGGGTGSLHLTAREPAVSEVTAGSGLYGPTLFDFYRAFQPLPAALFALPIVRRPGPAVATALGGGYLASGPADSLRLPTPYLPAGLRLDRQEGAGEVQTPLLGAAANELAVGDRVWFRHTKAGELCERFDQLHLLSGGRIVETVPTYRGEGRCFL